MYAESLADPQLGLRIVFTATPLDVRGALAALRRELAAGNVAAADAETAEIVLAEALNNIVEHAYGCSSGQIELQIVMTEDGLDCLILDEGRALNVGQPVAPSPAPDCLAEGGFGWNLILGLAWAVDYFRREERNCLHILLGRTRIAPAA